MSLVACAVVAATRVDAEMLTQRYASTAFIFLCEYRQTNHQNQTLERKTDPLAAKKLLLISVEANVSPMLYYTYSFKACKVWICSMQSALNLPLASRNVVSEMLTNPYCWWLCAPSSLPWAVLHRQAGIHLRKLKVYSGEPLKLTVTCQQKTRPNKERCSLDSKVDMSRLDR